MKYKQLIEETVEAAADKLVSSNVVQDCVIDNTVHIHVEEAMNTLALAAIENAKAIQVIAELAKPARHIENNSIGIKIGETK